MDAVGTHRVFGWLRTLGRLSARDIAHLPKLGIDAVVKLSPSSPAEALAGVDAALMRHATTPGEGRA